MHIKKPKKSTKNRITCKFSKVAGNNGKVKINYMSIICNKQNKSAIHNIWKVSLWNKLNKMCINLLPWKLQDCDEENEINK